MTEPDPPAPHARPWRPTPLIRASVLLHGLGLVGCVARPAAWPWVVGGVLANHAVLTAAGLWPRSRWLGPNWLRLPASAVARGEVALTIDDGPDPEVTPRVLELLERHGARASFFCIGARVAAHADLARDIVRAGHDVENHSQHHRHTFSLLGPAGLRAEIGAAQRQIAAVTGSAPRFFRAPAGLRNPFLEPVLAQQGLQLASWTRRGFDTVTREPQRVLARLRRELAAGDILLLHDGHVARTEGGEPVSLAVLPALLDACRERGLRVVGLRSATC